MAITYNRRPLTFNTPSRNDVQQYYFNHCNWKGINQNHNFLLVDQETFSDAKNVYVDDKGVLKSRLPFNLQSSINGKKIKDLQIFGDVALCVYVDVNGDWHVGAIDIDNETWTVDLDIFDGYPLKAFRNGDYIYIFVNGTGFVTYDVKNKIFESSLYYEPITRIYTGGKFETYEDENLFSNYERYQYILFPSVNSDLANVISPNAIGKTGTYTHYINEEKITHEIYIDHEENFLNIIHEQLMNDSSGAYVTNAYGQMVPTMFIHNNFIYKYNRGSLYRASVSDLIFERIYRNDLSWNSFVKIKISSNDEILIIHSDGCRILDLNGNLLFNGFGNVDNLTSIFIDADYAYSKNNIPMGLVLSLNDHDLILHGYDFKNTKEIRLNLLTLESEPSSIISANTACLSASGFINDQCALINVSIDDLNLNTYNLTEIIRMRGTPPSVSARFGSLSRVEQNELYDVYQYSVVDASVFMSRKIKSSLLYSLDNLRMVTIYGGFSYYKDGKNYIEYGVLDGTKFENSINSNDSYYYNGSLYKNTTNGLFLVTDDGDRIITDRKGTLLLHDFSKYWLYVFSNEKVIVSNFRVSQEDLYVKVERNNFIDVDLLMKSYHVYCTSQNYLYVGDVIEDIDDNLEKLYFKKSNFNKFDSMIVGLHQISDKELAIFTVDDVWYSTEDENILYYRSKIEPKLKNNSNLITLQDSTTTLMPSTTGIVALSYQNFVNTTEQSTTYLTQDVLSLYSKFSTDVKSLNWKHYTLFYESDRNHVLLYDTRLQSWWYWELPKNVEKLFIIDVKLYAIAEGKIFIFSDDFNEYVDMVEPDVKLDIDWFIESQKLHFNQVNYYKHISNITLSAVQDGDTPFYVNLNVKNYRKTVDDGKAENFDYVVEVIRTFVKRLNYAKVCEFQYRLSSDNEYTSNTPLSLSNITIKYRIGGQVK